MAVDRSDLIAHLRRTRFSPGDKLAGRRDAELIASFLRKRNGAGVWGIGSLFEGIRPFRKGSDIDLSVKGIPKECFFEALAEVRCLTDFDVDLIPLDHANDLMREIVRDRGVRL